MTGAMVVVGNGTPLQPLVAMLIQMLFLLLVLKMAPYQDDLDDWSSFVSSLALTLTTLAGYTLMVKTESNDLDYVLPTNNVANFLVVSNATCFVYQMVVIGWVAYQDRLQRRASLQMSGGKKTQVQPIVDTAIDTAIDTGNKCELTKEDAKELKSWGMT